MSWYCSSKVTSVKTCGNRFVFVSRFSAASVPPSLADTVVSLAQHRLVRLHKR